MPDQTSLPLHKPSPSHPHSVAVNPSYKRCSQSNASSAAGLSLRTISSLSLADLPVLSCCKSAAVCDLLQAMPRKTRPIKGIISSCCRRWCCWRPLHSPHCPKPTIPKPVANFPGSPPLLHFAADLSLRTISSFSLADLPVLFFTRWMMYVRCVPPCVALRRQHKRQPQHGATTAHCTPGHCWCCCLVAYETSAQPASSPTTLPSPTLHIIQRQLHFAVAAGLSLRTVSSFRPVCKVLQSPAKFHNSPTQHSQLHPAPQAAAAAAAAARESTSAQSLLIPPSPANSEQTLQHIYFAAAAGLSLRTISSLSLADLPVRSRR